MRTAATAAGLDRMLAAHAPHALHAGERHWPQTNCYVDLWVELLHAWDRDPLAGLGFCVAQDYEGDQFTFGKYQIEELDGLYGLRVGELSVYDRLETQLAAQAARGRVTLVEVDGYHLPDTAGTTYRHSHGKTTIGVAAIDPAAGRLGYFHNSGFHALDGTDYAALFGPRPADWMPPYTEFCAERQAPPAGEALTRAALERLRHHFARRPSANPVRAWAADFEAHLDRLFDGPPALFHLHAFQLNRQLGCNWELLGDHLAWLQRRGVAVPDAAVAGCARIAEGAKVLQFRMARLVARKRRDPCADALADLADAHDAAVDALSACAG